MLIQWSDKSQNENESGSGGNYVVSCFSFSKIILIIAFLFGSLFEIDAQIDPNSAANFCATKTDSGYDKRKLRQLIIGESLVYTSAMTGLYFVWYKDEFGGGFHSFDDSKEWLMMDKFGHFTTAFVLSELSYKAYSWTSLDSKKSNRIAFLQSMLFMTSLEMLDGFSQGWGFSWSDMGFNLLGASLNFYRNSGYHSLQIMPKFSFGKSEMAQYRPYVLGNTFPSRLLKDYNGQTYWLSFNYLPKTKASVHWTNGISLALGYGAHGMTGGHENVLVNEQGNAIPEFQRFRQFYISLDYDWTKLPAYQNGNGFIKVVCKGLNIFKFPFPGLEFSRGKVFVNWTGYGN